AGVEGTATIAGVHIPRRDHRGDHRTDSQRQQNGQRKDASSNRLLHLTHQDRIETIRQPRPHRHVSILTSTHRRDWICFYGAHCNLPLVVRKNRSSRSASARANSTTRNPSCTARASSSLMAVSSPTNEKRMRSPSTTMSLTCGCTNRKRSKASAFP